MTKPEVLYPNLKYFFSGYFHQHWTSMYDWSDRDPSYTVVVRDFQSEDPSETINPTIKELEKLISRNLPEDELREIVVRGLGANFRPIAIGLTYQQWLKCILKILKDS